METPLPAVERLLLATNQHDLDALVECFAEDYDNETPGHPARGFHGREQVRRNWEKIFSLVPDVRAEVTRIAVEGDIVWSDCLRAADGQHVRCVLLDEAPVTERRSSSTARTMR